MGLQNWVKHRGRIENAELELKNKTKPDRQHLGRVGEGLVPRGMMSNAESARGAVPRLLSLVTS